MPIGCRALIARYAHSMLSEPSTKRVPFVIDLEQLRAIDDWRRKQPDLPTRSEAIRRLLHIALQADRTGGGGRYG